MVLIVNELTSASLYQEITPTKNTLLVAIRPHLYVHNLPAGSLKLQLLDANEEVITESETILISTITAATYYHGYVRFYIDYYLQKDVTYKVKLVGSSYTFAETGYVGWCNGYDLGKYSNDFVVTNNTYAALDYEIWSKKA